MRWVAPPEKDAGTDTLERRLWDAADQLRANSGLSAAQYSQPVLGLIFLRFAEARFSVRRAVLESQAKSSRRGRMMFETLTIEEATERLIDYRGKTPPKTERGIRLITAKVIKGGRILDTPAEFISPDFYDEWLRRGLPRPLDVLVTTEAPLGEVAILRGSEKVALAQRVILLRARPGKIDPRFLYYALQGEFAQGELRARASGTTVSGIKQSELRQVRIPTFSLPIQERIVEVLSAFDDLLDNNLRRIRTLEEIARTLYWEWFGSLKSPDAVPRDGSRDLPEGWTGARLRDCVEIDPKVVVPREGEKPFVSMGALSNDSMLIAEVEQRTGNSGSKFQNGDILFARITPCLENGKTGFVQFLPDARAVAFGSTEFIVLRSRTLTPRLLSGQLSLGKAEGDPAAVGQASAAIV